MVRKKALIVNKMHPSIEPLLLKAGWEPDLRPHISREEILEILPEYEGLIIRSKTIVDEELVSKANNLQFVARAGAGVDQIDISALERNGILLINAPEGNRSALGEHTVGMLLSLLHNINRADREVRAGKWRREANRGLELAGKTVGIYGFGYMGSAFAEKLGSFGCRIIAFDKYKEGFGDRYVQEVTLEHFKRETEILSIHVPLTSETKEFFSLDYLRGFPNLKFILNTSRGEVLKIRDLLTLLDEEQILGAGLDVLENEKLNALSEEEKQLFNELTTRENVILTPHVAGWTHESYKRINEIIVKKMVELGLAEDFAHTSKK